VPPAGGEMAQISETTLRQQLADCHRMMVMAELLDYSGHVSARIPGTDRILILPRDASRAGVTADDMLVVGLDGKVLDGNRLPPTETAIHLGVYRARPDVHAIGHGHPPMATLFTMLEQPVIAMRNFGFRFVGMPIHPDPTHIRTLEQGAEVARTLGRHKYCLLRGHGSVVAVDSVQEVFLAAWRWRRTRAAPSRARASQACLVRSSRSPPRRSSCSRRASAETSTGSRRPGSTTARRRVRPGCCDAIGLAVPMIVVPANAGTHIPETGADGTMGPHRMSAVADMRT
jgi:ribulose-5-phosphate 4-epimerase/fuculose-1-phosphate aldolase